MAIRRNAAYKYTTTRKIKAIAMNVVACRWEQHIQLNSDLNRVIVNVILK